MRKTLESQATNGVVVSERTSEGRLTEVEEIPTVSNAEWQRRKALGIEVLEVISRHVQFERTLQGKLDMGVNQLCPEQKITLANDLEHVVGRR